MQHESAILSIHGGKTFKRIKTMDRSRMIERFQHSPKTNQGRECGAPLHSKLADNARHTEDGLVEFIAVQQSGECLPAEKNGLM